MLKIDKEYLAKTSREERRKHLDLNSACVERGGDSRNHRGALALYLDTTIPVGRICLCHACHNGKCCNPKHLYWGSDSDNLIDQHLNGRPSLNALTAAKHGPNVHAFNKKTASICKGTIWITNGFSSKRILSTEVIPDGWLRGRHKNALVSPRSSKPSSKG